MIKIGLKNLTVVDHLLASADETVTQLDWLEAFAELNEKQQEKLRDGWLVKNAQIVQAHGIFVHAKGQYGRMPKSASADQVRRMQHLVQGEGALKLPSGQPKEIFIFAKPATMTANTIIGKLIDLIKVGPCFIGFPCTAEDVPRASDKIKIVCQNLLKDVVTGHILVNLHQGRDVFSPKVIGGGQAAMHLEAMRLLYTLSGVMNRQCIFQLPTGGEKVTSGTLASNLQAY